MVNWRATPSVHSLLLSLTHAFTGANKGKTERVRVRVVVCVCVCARARARVCVCVCACACACVYTSTWSLEGFHLKTGLLVQIGVQSDSKCVLCFCFCLRLSGVWFLSPSLPLSLSLSHGLAGLRFQELMSWNHEEWPRIHPTPTPPKKTHPSCMSVPAPPSGVMWRRPARRHRLERGDDENRFIRAVSERCLQNATTACPAHGKPSVIIILISWL